MPSGFFPSVIAQCATKYLFPALSRGMIWRLVGVFPQWKSANATNEGFCPLESWLLNIYQPGSGLPVPVHVNWEFQ